MQYVWCLTYKTEEFFPLRPIFAYISILFNSHFLKLHASDIAGINSAELFTELTITFASSIFVICVHLLLRPRKAGRSVGLFRFANSQSIVTSD